MVLSFPMRFLLGMLMHWLPFLIFFREKSGKTSWKKEKKRVLMPKENSKML